MSKILSVALVSLLLWYIIKSARDIVLKIKEKRAHKNEQSVKEGETAVLEEQNPEV